MQRTIFFLLLLSSISFVACEEELKLPTAFAPADEIWVEGFIEAYVPGQDLYGEEVRPPYVFLRQTLSPARSYSLEELENIFVDAKSVTVSDSERTYELQRFCINDGGVTEETRQNIIDDFDLDEIIIPAVGVRADSINFCLYVDLLREIEPKIGETYTLQIELEDRTITASTTIPPHVPIDSMYYVSPFTDTTFATNIKQMRITLNDSDTLNTYYRYFTNVNNGSFIPGFDSVIDGAIFDEDVTDFPLLKGELRNLDTNTGGNLFGNYKSGNDVIVKWCNIDEAHYNFWDSFEFNLDNQGVFSSYVGTEWNVEGALGVWGGYSVSLHRDTVPR